MGTFVDKIRTTAHVRTMYKRARRKEGGRRTIRGERHVSVGGLSPIYPVQLLFLFTAKTSKQFLR
jgi:hypothetical protein